MKPFFITLGVAFAIVALVDMYRPEPEDSLTRYHDNEVGVTCWHLDGTNTLACVPDLLLTKRPSPKREQAVPAIQASADL